MLAAMAAIAGGMAVSIMGDSRNAVTALYACGCVLNGFGVFFLYRAMISKSDPAGDP
jgi:hypothetical protein